MNFVSSGGGFKLFISPFPGTMYGVGCDLAWQWVGTTCHSMLLKLEAAEYQVVPAVALSPACL